MRETVADRERCYLDACKRDWTFVRVYTDSQQKIKNKGCSQMFPVPSTGRYSMEFYSSAGPWISRLPLIIKAQVLFELCNSWARRVEALRKQCYLSHRASLWLVNDASWLVCDWFFSFFLIWAKQSHQHFKAFNVVFTSKCFWQPWCSPDNFFSFHFKIYNLIFKKQVWYNIGFQHRDIARDRHKHVT